VASPEAGAIAVLRSSGKREGNDRTDAAGPAFVRPFTVSIPDAEIDDLKMRLARTRWPDPETVGDWKLIGPLTDPVSSGGDAADSFDVVVPSLPGFGFSLKPAQTGWTVSRIASAWAELMKRLGCTRWAAQGGDWGAVVTTALGAGKDTVLSWVFADQAALYGVIAQLEALGLELIEVRRLPSA
jgi:pimeloyl-ACP methyl ester carboxylesterase